MNKFIVWLITFKMDAGDVWCVPALSDSPLSAIRQARRMIPFITHDEWSATAMQVSLEVAIEALMVTFDNVLTQHNENNDIDAFDDAVRLYGHLWMAFDALAKLVDVSQGDVSQGDVSQGDVSQGDVSQAT